MFPTRLSGFTVTDETPSTEFGFIWQQQGTEAVLIHPQSGILRTTADFCEQIESVAQGETDRSTLPDPLRESLNRVENQGYLTDSHIYKLTPPSQQSIWTVTAAVTGLLALATAITLVTLEAQGAAQPSRLQLVIAVAFFAVTTVCHELGHKVACWPHFNPGFSVTLLHRFIPTATTKTNLAWLVSRRRRIIINCAGVAIDSVIICLVGAVGVITGHISFASILIGIVGIRLVASLNPFIETDAYWLIVDLLQKPNLRSHGRMHLSNRQLTVESVYYGCSLGMIGIFGVILTYQLATVALATL